MLHESELLQLWLSSAGHTSRDAIPAFSKSNISMGAPENLSDKGFITTTASMVALINSIVAADGIALLAGGLFREKRTLLASLIGAAVALLLMAAFYLYQKWRYERMDVAR